MIKSDGINMNIIMLPRCLTISPVILPYMSYNFDICQLNNYSFKSPNDETHTNFVCKPA